MAAHISNRVVTVEASHFSGGCSLYVSFDTHVKELRSSGMEEDDKVNFFKKRILDMAEYYKTDRNGPGPDVQSEAEEADEHANEIVGEVRRRRGMSVLMGILAKQTGSDGEIVLRSRS